MTILTAELAALRCQLTPEAQAQFRAVGQATAAAVQAAAQAVAPGQTEFELAAHLSFEAQVPFVAESFYRDVPNLVLLHVDESLLTAELKVEQLDGAPEPFPHLYGPLNVDAVVAVTDPFVV